MKHLRNPHSGGLSRIRAEHLKRRMAAARKSAKDKMTAGEETTKSKYSTESVESTAPTEVANWDRVVDLVHTVFREGRLAEEVTWQAVVLIPKGKQYYRVVGLMEVMWKVVAAILNRRLMTSITFHDFLHIFRAVRGTGTATLEAKLLQKLAALREEFLYVVFLDLHKAYYALDRSRCLEILEGYSVGPRARRLLQTYWRRLTMVASSDGYYGTALHGYRGVTQVDPLSPIIFNVVVDVVVRNWVTVLVAGTEKWGEPVKEGRHRAALFYAENGMVA